MVLVLYPTIPDRSMQPPNYPVLVSDSSHEKAASSRLRFGNQILKNLRFPSQTGKIGEISVLGKESPIPQSK